MKIISIDPGYERLGIAIIEKEPKSKEILIFSECFKTSAKLPHPERLGLIKNRIEEVIVEFNPEKMAIETLFFTNNQKTVMQVSEARGAIISTAQSMGVAVSEFGPGEIKVAVTGYGKSDKSAIIGMIPRLIKVNKVIKHDDEFDAIAVGLTYFAHNGKF